MSGVRWAHSIAALALLAGCTPASEPGVYDIALHEAYTRLAQNKLEDFKFKRQCGILIHFRPESILDKSVTWRVYSSGPEMLVFTANLTSVGERSTRVDVSISKEPDGSEAYDGTDVYPRPALIQPVRPAVEEAIAAVLEEREFDAQRVPRSGDNSVCQVQRAGLEHGHRFSVDDESGTWDRGR